MVMSLIKFSKGDDIQLSEHFNSWEFECPCDRCTVQVIDMDLIEHLEKLRAHFNQPINIDSGYRCPHHNTDVGGALHSQHVRGKAADVKITNVSPSTVWKYVTDTKMFDGIGRYQTFNHLDVRGYLARWDNR